MTPRRRAHQVRRDLAGMTFASALEWLLSQDPEMVIQLKASGYPSPPVRAKDLRDKLTPWHEGWPATVVFDNTGAPSELRTGLAGLPFNYRVYLRTRPSDEWAYL
jgi:hypothetical protein